MNEDEPYCKCFLNPTESKCGDWEGNRSACLCADFGTQVETLQPLPG